MSPTVGILGAGQLARMLALAAHELGVKTLCYDNSDASSAAAVTQTVRGSFEDSEALLAWAKQCDVITYETENIDLAALDILANQGREVVPSRRALTVMQNRFLEKTFCQQLGLATAPFALVHNEAQLREALLALSYPCVLKTATQGYDGKGQYKLNDKSDISALVLSWDKAYVLERWLAHQGECSLLSARGYDGEIIHYPLTHNQHQHGMLATSKAPYENALLQQKANHIAERILQHFDYVGVLAIEFFIMEDELLINEMAPRVHNSFHWTIEGARTSQFANHLRALLHLPLGDSAAIAPSYLYNCIGQLPACERILAHANTYYHDYGKTARPGRKLGHITWCDFDNEGQQGISTMLES
ncbi:MAG: 5-(carboxyamino)imidazole ribonucleotide synthase, partial [Gammaproteobacteria bacterium]|nr:5-(carboxyamino)imidazole ribonucleotide synthase [Gammaproteobacteria bacterium]